MLTWNYLERWKRKKNILVDCIDQIIWFWSKVKKPMRIPYILKSSAGLPGPHISSRIELFWRKRTLVAQIIWFWNKLKILMNVQYICTSSAGLPGPQFSCVISGKYFNLGYFGKKRNLNEYHTWAQIIWFWDKVKKPMHLHTQAFSKVARSTFFLQNWTTLKKRHLSVLITLAQIIKKMIVKKAMHIHTQQGCSFLAEFSCFGKKKCRWVAFYSSDILDSLDLE